MQKYEPIRTLAEKYAIYLSRSELKLADKTASYTDSFPFRWFPAFSNLQFELAERFRNLQFELAERFQSKFTGTHKFKYRPKYQGIPIYGSSVLVKLDDKGKDLFADSSLSVRDEAIKEKFPPSEPKIEEKELPICIKEYYGKQGQFILLEEYDLNPSLHYYFEPYENGSSYGEWRLVYVTAIKANPTSKADRNDVKRFVESAAMKDKRSITPKSLTSKDVIAPELFDYVIDAHSGEVITRLSNIRTFC